MLLIALCEFISWANICLPGAALNKVLILLQLPPPPPPRNLLIRVDMVT